MEDEMKDEERWARFQNFETNGFLESIPWQCNQWLNFEVTLDNSSEGREIAAIVRNIADSMSKVYKAYRKEPPIYGASILDD
jgi:hypothetical protein